MAPVTRSNTRPRAAPDRRARRPGLVQYVFRDRPCVTSGCHVPSVARVTPRGKPAGWIGSGSHVGLGLERTFTVNEISRASDRPRVGAATVLGRALWQPNTATITQVCDVAKAPALGGGRALARRRASTP